MGKKAEKGKKGEAVQYFSRKQALRHLQISLPMFTRLCQWKGLHPTEPKNKKAVNKGDTTPKIYYKRKDINYLLHEPVINKLREMRCFTLKLRKAKERKDKDKIFRLLKNKPRYTLHHIVRELYPTREDALNNLEDCLKSIFIFATLPKMSQFSSSYINLCKRLKLEFMNYCITKQAVRKCFISIKGFTIGVEIMGVNITWIMPHQHAPTNTSTSADYRTLANQLEFDCTMLSSLLKNLYIEAGLVYPPKFVIPESQDGSEWSENDILASMSFPLITSENDIGERLEQLNQFKDMDEELAAAAEKETQVASIQNLFKDKKVFLNREVPREIFCFLLRSCGANVSWDNIVADGSSFSEDDEGIQYQIIDRPLHNPRVSRFYVSPQYVCDSINAARLLPVKDYMPGMKIIPHLSPFVDFTKGYVPPEYKYLKGEIDAENLYVPDDVDESDDEAVEEQDFEDDEEEEDIEDELDDMMDMDQDVEEEEVKEKKKEVKSKKLSKKNRKSKEEMDKEIEARKEIKLREMSLPRKRLNLYNKMKHAEKKKITELENMKKKRQEVNKKRAKSNN